MYQLAVDYGKVDKTRLFIESCTSMVPTTKNMHLVRSAAALVRGALDGGDINLLRDFVRRITGWRSDAHDILAAASQAVLDEMDHLPRIGLHDAVRRVAQIERDALAFGATRDVEGNVRTAYAS